MLAVMAWWALAGEGGFFERRDVDFWEARRRAAEAPPAELWSDSAAPPPVKRLLERPGPETARAYLAWQEERFRKLRAAIAALEDLRPAAAPRGQVLYFARDGCRWCARQEEELRGLDVVRVPPGSPLWAELGVTVTPTLAAGGTVFRGFTPRESLLKELGRD